MKKVLITGGAGFIGSHLAEYYAVQGNQVIVLDNLSRMKLLGQNQSSNLQICRFANLQIGTLTNWEFLSQFDNVQRIRGDVRDDETVEAAVTGVDVIFHCAAQTAVTRAVIDPKTDFTTNVIGTFNILEAARHAPKSPAIVFCSTNKVYGDNLNRIPLSEEKFRYILDEAYQDGIPEEFTVDGCEHTPYGCSKLASDLYMQDYARLYGLKIGVFRMSCIYGTRQFGVEDQGWVAWFVIAALLDKPITIYGDGKQVRDVLYVTDLVRAFDHFVQSDLSHLVVNIGGGPRNTLSLRELTQLLEELLGKKIHVQYAEWRPSDQKVYISNIEKVKTALKWKPSVSPVEGIINLLSWARANRLSMVD